MQLARNGNGERVGWLDTARAIGIVAVVAGHVTSDRAIWAAIFHFHMPLFFMLSGMTFTPGPLRELAARRTRSLLVPYAGWLLLVAIADAAIAAAVGHAAHLPWDRSASALARLVLGGTFLVGPFGIFWFVTCLFLVQLLASPILRRPERHVLIAAALLLIGIHFVRHWPSPLGVIGVPAGLFFFLAGALYRRHARRLTWPLAGCAGLALVSAPLDLKIAAVGTPLVSVLAALGLCHLAFVAARWLRNVPAIAVVGRASLVITYLHLTVLYALRGRMPEGLIAMLGVAVPVVVWMALRRWPRTRCWLLGEWPRRCDRPQLRVA